ncbi:MAG TPA: helix-turn-helix domain-containing protein [Terriglobia bacterium]|nr:helix-turn-helix domain-containing protein [Terriglobia bacterium]
MKNGQKNSTGNDKASVVMDGYLTPEKLARDLGASPRTLARWHSRRIGPPRTTVGRTILYRREAVEDWLRGREERPLRGAR